MLFGDDESQQGFAKGNFSSQLLLESLDSSSSADERRNHSFKSSCRQRALCEMCVFALHLRLCKVDVCTSHVPKEKGKTALCLKLNSPEAGICL